MKKYLLAVFFTFSLLGAGTIPGYAAAVAGALEPTQILNNIELIGVNISDAATTANTYLLQVKETVLDPLADSLIVVSQLQTANDIITLVNGGYQGSSLIIGNPRNFIDQKGLGVVKTALGSIANQGGPFSDSLLSSLTINFKSAPFTDRLKEINSSAVPSLIQDKACDEEMLSNLAREDVLADSEEGAELDQDAYRARKTELFDALCTGNPDQDPKLAETLTEINKQRPDIGGWDSWLALTSGENDYTRSVRTNLETEEEKRKVEEAEKQKLDWGRGVASQTECVVPAPYDVNGESYDDEDSAPCIEDAVLNPGSLLQDSLTKAANAGLERLNNIQGVGSLIQSLTSIANLANGIRSVGSSVTGATGSSSGGKGNTSTSGSSATSAVNDLANDPAKKASAVDPIKKLLANDSKTIQDLRATDQAILTDLQFYESKLNEVKSCYADVAPNDAQANALFTHRDSIIGGLRANIANDMSKTSASITLIQNLSNLLTTSQSTKQIMDAFFNYQDATADSPDYRALAERRGEYTRNKSQSTADTGQNGELTRLGQRCETMRAQRDAQRYGYN